MALEAFDFTFAKTAGPTTGSQVIVANIPFEPTGFRFMSSGSLVSGVTAEKRWQAYGFAVPPGTGSRQHTAPFTSSIDQIARCGFGSSGTYGFAYDETACIIFSDLSGISRAALTSIDALGGGLFGITINWIANVAGHGARLVHCTAYRDDLVLFHWAVNTPATASPPQVITGVGFQAAAVLTLGGDAIAGPGPTGGPGYHLHWSAFNCQLEQVGVSQTPSNGGGQEVGYRYQSAVSAIPIIGDPNTPPTSDEALRGVLTVSSMDADGWTLTSVATSSTAYGYGLHSLAFQTASSKIGKFVKQATSTADQSVSTPDVTPVVVELFGSNNTSSESLDFFDRLAFGTQTTSGASFATAGSNPRTPDVAPFVSVDWSANPYAVINNNTATIQALMTKGALASGSFTVGYASNDSEATEILFAALGSGGGGTCAGPVAGSFAGTWVDTQMVPVFA